MKRIFCIVLSLMLLATMIVGCGGGTTTTTTPQNTSGNNDATSGNNDATSGNNDATGGDETTEPEEPVELVIGITEVANVLDWYNNAQTKWIEEACNVKLKFKFYSTTLADLKKQFSTETVAGEKLPDLMIKFRLGDDLIDQYGADGYFLDLTEYFNDPEKSANFWELFNNEAYLPKAERDRIWNSIHSIYDDEPIEESPIYSFPSVEISMIDTMQSMPLINQKWLDVVQMQAPTTLDELVAVLRAFKNTDCNGDGWPNEIPLLGTATHVLPWLINFFIYYNEDIEFNLDENGNLYLPYNQDAYRDALKFMRSLHEEGLMAAGCLTYRNGQMLSVLESADLVGVALGHPSLIFDVNKTTIQNFAPLNLYGNTHFNLTTMFRDCFISSECENPDKAWEVLMTLCTIEGGMRVRYGEPGVDWDWADEGAVSMMGIPAIIKVHKDILGMAGSSNWGTTTGGIFVYTENEAIQAADNASESVMHKYKMLADLHTNFSNAEVNNVNQALVCPWLRFNDEEEEMAPQSDYILTEAQAWLSKFVTGEKDINSDTDWAEYLQVLDNLGLDEYVIAGQHCYDRMYKS